MATIKFDAVTKSYGLTQALHPFSLDVAEGELLTILGPSGSGKSTILLIMAGLAAATSGHISLSGRDVTDLPAQERKIGLVFQNYALFPHLTVFDNVAFPLSVRRHPKREIAARVQSALARVRLSNFGGRFPAQLSGGQQQRVALARAIVFEPTILLLDEPLGALDRKLREEVQVELKGLQRELGITTLLVTHDQEEALTLSDRILVLDHGRVQQLGTPREIYARPATRFVAGFFGQTNLFEGRIAAGAGVRLLTGGLVECATDGWADGAPVAITIRPERIRLAPGGCGVGVPAQIVSSVFLGQLQRWHLQTDGGLPMVVAAADGFAPGTGDRVLLNWARDDVWLIPEPVPADGASAQAAA